MKQTPEELTIIKRMAPGLINQHGFLGSDQRHLHEIIQADEEALAALGKNAEEIATRMKYFMDSAAMNYDSVTVIDDCYNVEIASYMGYSICPWPHSGRYSKTLYTLTNTKNNTTVIWTPLHVHMIEEHHFFEGMDAKFRLDPVNLVKALY